MAEITGDTLLACVDGSLFPGNNEVIQMGVFEGDYLVADHDGDQGGVDDSSNNNDHDDDDDDDVDDDDDDDDVDDDDARQAAHTATVVEEMERAREEAYDDLATVVADAAADGGAAVVEALKAAVRHYQVALQMSVVMAGPETACVARLEAKIGAITAGLEA